MKLKGTPASPGIAIGSVYIFLGGLASVPRYQLKRKRDVHREIARFDKALDRLRNHFIQLRDSLDKSRSQDPLLILQTHVDLLADPQIRETTIKLIEEQSMNVEAAFHQAIQDILLTFSKIEDVYLRERADDIKHLGRAVLEELQGARKSGPRDPEPDSIIFAKELAPHELIEFSNIPVAGIVTELGSAVNHTSILARTLGIPMVVGANGILATATGAATTVIDGGGGYIIFDPKPEAAKAAKRKHADQQRRNDRAREASQAKAITPDDVEVHFFANLESPEEVNVALNHGAQGIGLYRTEFLFLNRNSIPSTGELTRHYSKVVKRMQGRSVTFRTLDIGGDKLPTKMEFIAGDNPAMGLRGIRHSLREPQLFKRQISAILRASNHGPVRILLPMISSYDELDDARILIEEQCEQDKIASPPVGIMIETPSSVILADLLSRRADFFSIGTNDLIQYALAIDRGNASVSEIYSPLNPAILRMLQQVNDVGNQAGIEVGICGEIAGSPLMFLILLGMGFNTLSMNPRAIPTIHAMVRRTNQADAQQLLQGIMALRDIKDIEAMIQRKLESDYLDLL